MPSNKCDLNVNQIHLKGIKSLLGYSLNVLSGQRGMLTEHLLPQICAESLGVRIPSSLQWLLSDSAGTNIRDGKEISSVPSSKLEKRWLDMENSHFCHIQPIEKNNFKCIGLPGSRSRELRGKEACRRGRTKMHMKVGRSQGPSKLFLANLEKNEVEKRCRMIQYAKDLLLKESQ